LQTHYTGGDTGGFHLIILEHIINEYMLINNKMEMKMKVPELIEKNLISSVGEKYECGECKKLYTKIGIANHYFYTHTEEGRLKKEVIRQKAVENNNTPEMKKKISEATLKAYNEGDARINHLKVVQSKKSKEKHKKIQTNLWKDEEYHKRQSSKIKESHENEDFRTNMSKTISAIHNDPDSTVKSEEFRLKHKEIALEQWQDPEFVENQIKSRLESWTIDRRLNQSKKIKKCWKNVDHIEKVLRGKLDSLIKTGQRPSLGRFGITDLGTIYESRFEQEVYEYLEENNYPFEAHVIYQEVLKYVT